MTLTSAVVLAPAERRRLGAGAQLLAGALVVAALMAKAGWNLIRDSWRIFLEAAPSGIDIASLDRDLHAVDGVLDIHDLHVWEVTSGFPALSAHVLVDPDYDCHERRQTITSLLHDRHGLDHTTLQVDHPASTVVAPEQLRQRLVESGEPKEADHYRH